MDRCGILQDYVVNCHYSFDWDGYYGTIGYMGLADVARKPFHYDGSVYHEDYGQVYLVEMR